MPTNAGKAQRKDLKQGKTFYMVNADFPIIAAGVVGNGEVEQVRRIRIKRGPFYRQISKTIACRYYNDRNLENLFNVDEMEANHANAELVREAPYFAVFVNKKAAERFIKSFDDRKPSEREKKRTLLREAGLNAKQRGFK